MTVGVQASGANLDARLAVHLWIVTSQSRPGKQACPVGIQTILRDACSALPIAAEFPNILRADSGELSCLHDNRERVHANARQKAKCVRYCSRGADRWQAQIAVRPNNPSVEETS